MAKTKELQKRAWGPGDELSLVSFGSRLPRDERLSFERVNSMWYSIQTSQECVPGEAVTMTWSGCWGHVRWHHW